MVTTPLFPPTLRSVRNSRPAQGALTEKRGFRWRELNFWVQRHAARAGAIKGAWESDAFACDFGQRCRRQYLPYYRELSLVHFLLTYISHTYAGQALLRVRGRAMHLRVILDKGAAGNTCRIVKAHLLKSARKGALCRVPV